MKILFVNRADNKGLFEALGFEEDFVTIGYEEGNSEYLLQEYPDWVELKNNPNPQLFTELVGEEEESLHACYEDEYEDWYCVASSMTMEEAKKELEGFFRYQNGYQQSELNEAE